MSNRDRVAVRVPENIKDAFESAIEDKHGFKRPYAGIELERELKVSFGMGEESALFDSLRSLVEDPGQKKNYSDLPSFTGGDAFVNYRIHPEVRAELKRVSQEGTSSMGAIVARSMYFYALDEGHHDRMRDFVEQLKTTVTDEEDDLSATERRKRDIAEYLRANDTQHGEVWFTIEAFDKAAEEAAGLSTTSHARKQYLRPVLDYLGAIPTESGKFTTDNGPIEDLRGLPYDVLTEAEKETILKAEAIENAWSNQWEDEPPEFSRRNQFTVSDGVKVLDGTPSKKDVGRFFDEIESPWGFNYYPNPTHSDEPYLGVTPEVLADTNEESLRLADAWGASELADEADPEQESKFRGSTEVTAD